MPLSISVWQWGLRRFWLRAFILSRTAGFSPRLRSVRMWTSTDSRRFRRQVVKYKMAPIARAPGRDLMKRQLIQPEREARSRWLLGAHGLKSFLDDMVAELSRYRDRGDINRSIPRLATVNPEKF